MIQNCNLEREHTLTYTHIGSPTRLFDFCKLLHFMSSKNKYDPIYIQKVEYDPFTYKKHTKSPRRATPSCRTTYDRRRLGS
jgi:hypothetical protein